MHTHTNTHTNSHKLTHKLTHTHTHTHARKRTRAHTHTRRAAAEHARKRFDDLSSMMSDTKATGQFRDAVQSMQVKHVPSLPKFAPEGYQVFFRSHRLRFVLFQRKVLRSKAGLDALVLPSLFSRPPLPHSLGGLCSRQSKVRWLHPIKSVLVFPCSHTLSCLC